MGFLRKQRKPVSVHYVTKRKVGRASVPPFPCLGDMPFIGRAIYHPYGRTAGWGSREEFGGKWQICCVAARGVICPSASSLECALREQ